MCPISSHSQVLTPPRQISTASPTRPPNISGLVLSGLRGRGPSSSGGAGGAAPVRFHRHRGDDIAGLGGGLLHTFGREGLDLVGGAAAVADQEGGGVAALAHLTGDIG